MRSYEFYSLFLFIYATYKTFFFSSGAFDGLLPLKKGDLVQLHGPVHSNWMLGELGIDAR